MKYFQQNERFEIVIAGIASALSLVLFALVIIIEVNR